MLSGCGDISNYNNKGHYHNNVSSSSSPSISVSKTMEEVWKDITLFPSLQDIHSVTTPGPTMNHNHHHNHQIHNNPNYDLQDFLARPFNKDPPATKVHGIGINGVSISHPAETPVLNLNSLHGFDNEQFQVSNDSGFGNPFEGSGSSTGLSSLGKKRSQDSIDNDNNNNNNCGDRRHKRMIKNRESAARSRARKQAYTNELELEVEQLKEENARLKSQQKQLYLAAAAADQIPKKHTLHRTSTAPF